MKAARSSFWEKIDARRLGSAHASRVLRGFGPRDPASPQRSADRLRGCRDFSPREAGTRPRELARRRSERGLSIPRPVRGAGRARARASRGRGDAPADRPAAGRPPDPRGPHHARQLALPDAAGAAARAARGAPRRVARPSRQVPGGGVRRRRPAGRAPRHDRAAVLERGDQPAAALGDAARASLAPEAQGELPTRRAHPSAASLRGRRAGGLPARRAQVREGAAARARREPPAPRAPRPRRAGDDRRRALRGDARPHGVDQGAAARSGADLRASATSTPTRRSSARACVPRAAPGG